mmetsp:Transcript_2093/g.2377  ORF Transcript_2093/g.2377 Transcript_2093/m.2377 type:complete len:106 (-) Transcript_2093:27-344(-)
MMHWLVHWREVVVLVTASLQLKRLDKKKGLKPMKEPLGYILDEGPYGIWTVDPPRDVARIESSKNIDGKSQSFDKEQTLDTLQNYRQTVEDRIKNINTRLEQIED